MKLLEYIAYGLIIGGNVNSVRSNIDCYGWVNLSDFDRDMAIDVFCNQP